MIKLEGVENPANLEEEFAKYRAVQKEILRTFKDAKRNSRCPCGKGRKFKVCCWGRNNE